MAEAKRRSGGVTFSCHSQRERNSAASRYLRAVGSSRLVLRAAPQRNDAVSVSELSAGPRLWLRFYYRGFLEFQHT